MLVLHARPGGWLAVIGRAASPSEKTARANIVPQVRDGVKRPVPGAARPGAVRDSTLVAWYRCLYAPRTGGAYDSHHGTAGIADRARRRGGCMAARGARAAGRDAGGRVSLLWLA